MTRRRPCVAIDGPVGAGKSTIARLVARDLGYTYIDSGAMYRAVAWAARRDGVSSEDPEQMSALLAGIGIRLVPGGDGLNQVFVGECEVTGEIRVPEISQLASQFSELSEVRERLVALQQEMAREGGVVMEGRDIQTVVLPDAEVKIFLTASAEERARRRCDELQERGIEVRYEEVLADIQRRDERDSTRSHSPLRAAESARTVDTTDLTIEEVVERILSVVRERVAED